MVALGTIYIQTARDADVVPLWLNWTVILACRFVLSSCWDPEPLHVLGVVDRMQDASAGGVSHGDDATDQIRALFRQELRDGALFLSQKYLRGMVIGHRFGESREHGRLGNGREWGRVEAKMSNRIYLEDRIAGGVPVNRGLRCGVGERCGDVAAKNFAGVL